MTVTKQQIAESLMEDLSRDERELAEVQKRSMELNEKVQATKAWLKANGFLVAGPSPTTSISSVRENAVEGEKGDLGTVKDMAIKLVRQKGSMTVSDIYADLISVGKKVNRASVDATVRRNVDVFQMRKKNGRNVVTLIEGK
jgi:hypothetical protein